MISPNQILLNPGSDKPFEVDVLLPSGITVASAEVMIKASLADMDADALFTGYGSVTNDATYGRAAITFVITADFTVTLVPGASYFWAVKTHWSNSLQVTPEGCAGPVFVQDPGIIGPV